MILNNISYSILFFPRNSEYHQEKARNCKQPCFEKEFDYPGAPLIANNRVSKSLNGLY